MPPAAEPTPEVAPAPAPTEAVEQPAPEPETPPAPEPTPEPEPGPWTSKTEFDTTGGITRVYTEYDSSGGLQKVLRENGFKYSKKPRPNWTYRGAPADRDEALAAVRIKLAEMDALEREGAVQGGALEDAGKTPGKSFPPTPQQQDVIDNVAAGNRVAVSALAGTGKTSTLKMIAERHPKDRFLYIAFNRSIAAEARAKMPQNVTSKTADAVA